jgi:hypothetical protein
MQCPRCQSQRIQRDYDDSIIFLRAVGMHKLLCNQCGLEFKGFDPKGKLQRAPAPKRTRDGIPIRHRRRGPRFAAHLPTAISLIEGGAQPGKVSYSVPSRGHCDSISEFGMLLSLVGTRFAESELSRIGRLLFVRIELPEATIEAVVSIVTHRRVGEGAKKKWLLGVKVHQIAEADAEVLAAYIEKRAFEPV